MRKCFKFFCHRSLSSLLCDSVAVDNVLNTVIVMADFFFYIFKGPSLTLQQRAHTSYA